MHGVVTWVAYSISRSLRRYAGDPYWRAFDFDQTHLLTAVASVDLLGFTFGARARVASGFPRTPVESAFFDARGDQYQPVFGAQNTTRVPLFAQLDLQVEREFRLPGSRLHALLEVQNVTTRRNPEEIVYSHDFGEREYLTGLPLLAVAGVRWQF